MKRIAGGRSAAGLMASGVHAGIGGARGRWPTEGAWARGRSPAARTEGADAEGNSWGAIPVSGGTMAAVAAPQKPRQQSWCGGPLSGWLGETGVWAEQMPTSAKASVAASGLPASPPPPVKASAAASSHAAIRRPIRPAVCPATTGPHSLFGRRHSMTPGINSTMTFVNPWLGIRGRFRHWITAEPHRSNVIALCAWRLVAAGKYVM